MVDFKSTRCKMKGSKKQETKKELTETIQRLQADFENYKKRDESQNSEISKYAKAELINKLLSVLDSFELSLKNTDNKEEFIKGIELIYSQLFQTLEDMGLRKIDIEGCKFDPYKHEVLITQESDKKDGAILEELQKGYMLDDKVLRHTKVKISKKRPGDDKHGKRDTKC